MVAVDLDIPNYSYNLLNVKKNLLGAISKYFKQESRGEIIVACSFSSSLRITGIEKQKIKNLIISF